jgi:lipopolysaccharide export system protein LptA
MTRAMTILRLCACAAIAVAPMHGVAFAQQVQQSVPNALQGFSQNKDQPVKIEAASLEVRDKDKVATFSGNVIVTQGDTTMKCKSLVVHYDAESKEGKGMKSAQPGPGGSSSIKKLEALGGVLVTQKDQTATGDKGLFDMKSNSITLSGNVLITQGQNVLRGERLVVDVASGAARVEGGRVSGVFVPSSSDDKKDKDKDKAKDKDTKAKETPKEAPKPKETGKTSKAQDEAPTASAPATRPVAREPAAAPVTRDSYAPERTPAARDAGATPGSTKPIAPRGIY